jgi:hypothetical protein
MTKHNVRRFEIVDAMRDRIALNNSNRAARPDSYVPVGKKSINVG